MTKREWLIKLAELKARVKALEENQPHGDEESSYSDFRVYTTGERARDVRIDCGFMHG